MKNLALLVLSIFVVSVCTQVPSFAFGDLPLGTSEATRNVAPIIQHQFEKEETLDFVNDPEDYKRKRDAKDYLESQEGRVDVPPSVQSQFYPTYSRPGSNNLQFVRDENGKIKIKNVH